MSHSHFHDVIPIPIPISSHGIPMGLESQSHENPIPMHTYSLNETQELTSGHNQQELQTEVLNDYRQ